LAIKSGATVFTVNPGPADPASRFPGSPGVDFAETSRLMLPPGESQQSLVRDPGVKEAVDEIGNEIADDDEGCAENQDPHQDRVVAHR
jgi:hypothetical protein